MMSIKKRLRIMVGALFTHLIVISGIFSLYYTEDQINSISRGVESKIGSRLELFLSQFFYELSTIARTKEEMLTKPVLSNKKLVEDFLKMKGADGKSFLTAFKTQIQESLPDSFFLNVEAFIVDTGGIISESSCEDLISTNLRNSGRIWNALSRLRGDSVYLVPLAINSVRPGWMSFMYTRLEGGAFLGVALEINEQVYSDRLGLLKKFSVFIDRIGIYDSLGTPIAKGMPEYPGKLMQFHPFFREAKLRIQLQNSGDISQNFLVFIRLSFFSLFSIFIVNVILYSFLLASVLFVFLRFERLVREEVKVVEDVIEKSRNLEEVETSKKDLKVKEIKDTVEVFQNIIQKIQHDIALNRKLYNEFRESFSDFAEKLAAVAERFDPGEELHLKRVRYLTKLIVDNLDLDETYKHEIVEFSILHDIGKIFISPQLLNKEGPLTPEEREIVRRHTLLAEKLLEGPELKVAREIALYHHENYDGSGYPFGLKGEEIPLSARVVKIANTYDVMRSERPYKTAKTHEEALRPFIVGDEKTKPSDFDPALLKIFFKICSKGDPYARF